MRIKNFFSYIILVFLLLPTNLLLAAAEQAAEFNAPASGNEEISAPVLLPDVAEQNASSTPPIMLPPDGIPPLPSPDIPPTPEPEPPQDKPQKQKDAPTDPNKDKPSKDKGAQTESLSAQQTGATATSSSSSISNDHTADPFLNIKGFQNSFASDLFTGEARLSLPFFTPPGRNNFTPSLALSYSSFAKNLVSPYGYGFDFSVSSIFRTSSHGVDELYTRNDFAVKVNGKYNELVLAVATANRYMGKWGNDLSQYVFNPSLNQWIVTDEQGVTYYFGESAAARQVNPANTANTFQWMLTRVLDTNGNAIAYTYFQDSNNVYPQTIEYAFSGASLYKIVFGYAQKTASATTYQTQFPVSAYKILNSIDIRYNTGSAYATLRAYTFTYDSLTEAISRLARVTEKDASGTSLPSIDLAYYSSGAAIGLLSTINNNRGGAIALSYTPSTVYRDPTTGAPNALPFAVQTLSRIAYTDAVTNTVSTKDFTYLGGHYYYDFANVFTREYAGFHEVTAARSDGVFVKTFFHQSEFAKDNAQSSGEGEYQDHISKKGRVYREELYDAQGKLYQSTITKWRHADSGGRYQVLQDLITSLTWDGDATHRDTAAEYFYDQYGNVIKVVSFGAVSADANLGSFTDSGSDTVITTYNYAANTSANILTTPSQQTVYAGDGVTKRAETRYYYDGLALGGIAKGNLTRTEYWLNTSGYLSTTRVYNSYGLVVSETDARGNTTAYLYDAYNLYPSAITNSLGHKNTYTYEYAIGKVKRAADANGIVSETRYDGFGRPVTALASDQNQSPTLVVVQEVAYTDTSVPQSVLTRDYVASGVQPKSAYQYFDGFGRLIQTRASDDGAQFNVASVVYDTEGRVAKEYVPFKSGSPTYAATSQPVTQARVYSYDAMDRVVSIAASVGTTSNSYQDWTILTTDPNQHKKKTYYDAYGRIAQVDEHEGAVVGTTSYTYDTLGNLAKITDAESNIRNFTYDSLGRQLTNELPHTTSATPAVYRYEYDANGNKIKQTNPDGRVIVATHDVLNRVLTKDDPGTTGVEASYTYDTAQYGIGKLALVSTPTVAKAYQYDGQGNTREERQMMSQPEPNLIARWTFDEGSGAVAVDSSGNGNTGTVVGGAQWAQGRFGSALEFDGVNDYVDIGNNFSDSIEQAGTISAWVYKRGDGGGIFSRSVDTSWDGERLVIFFDNWNPSNPRWGWVISDGGYAQPSIFPNATFPNNQWAHVVLSWDSATVTTYLNGQIFDQRGQIPRPEVTGVKTRLGWAEGFGNSFMNGKLDEVRVYNRALTQQEVQSLYKQYDPTLIARWTFDEGSGAVAGDLSGNGNTGTVQGGAQWAQGRFGSALEFDGVNDYVDIGNNFSDSIEQAGTISAWVYKRGDGGGIFSRSVDTSWDGERLVVFFDNWNPSNPRWGWVISDGGYAQPSIFPNATFPNNQWAHVVLSWDSATVTTYLNGQIFDQRGQIPRPEVTGVKTRLGWAEGFGNSFMNGKLDEVRVYNRALTQQEVQSLYTNPGGTLAAVAATNQTYANGYTYDPYGALTQITYPDGSTVGYTYNPLGKIATVKRNGQLVVFGTGYSPTSALSQIQYANGVAQTYTYDANKLYRLVGKTTALGGSYLQNISYSYDGVGNVVGIADTGTQLPKTASFTYDGLDRLVSASITDGNTGATMSENYTYSKAGNILTKTDANGAKSYTYGNGVHPQAVTAVGGDTYSYDANGNMISAVENGVASAFVYDVFNRLVSVAKAAETSAYEYGDGYERVKKTLPSGKFTTYIGKLAEADGAGAFTNYVFADKMRVATAEGGNTYYNAADHLGSASLAVDAAGAVVQKLDYLPFGGERVNVRTGAFDARHTFTDQEKDEENGLMYYGARYYNPRIGRFTSVDPVDGDVTKPQTLNKYAYVSNNPLLYIDPTGQKLVISDAYGNAFAQNTYQSLRQIYPEIHLDQVQGGYEVKIDNWDRVSSWFSEDSKSLNLMKEVIDDDNIVTIVESNQADGNWASYDQKTASNGEGSDVTVGYYPEGYSLRINTVNDDGQSASDRARPPYIGLAHELIHANHATDGNIIGNTVGSYTDVLGNVYTPPYGPVKTEELRTVGNLGYDRKKDTSENDIRQEKGINMRNRY